MSRPFHILLVCLCAAISTAHGRPTWNATYQAYINTYRSLAIEQMLTHGIPASITMAQGLLESGAGRSTLATRGNNHFGIKCHNWTGPTMRRDDDAPNECFRVYRTVRESYVDHSKFLQQTRYQSLFRLGRTDYKGWARGLKACGYATSPTYAQQLIDVIEVYRLHDLDGATSYDRFAARHTGGSTLAGPPHELFYYNSNYYIRARRGDTFKTLAKETGISAARLARYNERSKSDILADGDVVYLKKKQKRATKDYRNRLHTIRVGESMHDIAQTYGIRLESLYQMNNLSPDYGARAGDKLRVR